MTLVHSIAHMEGQDNEKRTKKVGSRTGKNIEKIECEDIACQRSAASSVAQIIWTEKMVEPVVNLFKHAVKYSHRL